LKRKIIEQLIKAARDGLANSYGIEPGKRSFGAAVQTSSGNIYASGVYKSETGTLTLHAEQSALAHSAAHGEHIITAISIISDEDPSKFTNPCGLCKQLLYENSRRSGLSITVILANLNGEYQLKDLSEFIVYPWP
jgi:cytidine deaminase